MLSTSHLSPSLPRTSGTVASAQHLHSSSFPNAAASSSKQGPLTRPSSAPLQPPPPHPRRSSSEDDYANLRDILRNNREWVAAQTARDPSFFERLGRGQSPKYFYIGCADSRVPANEIMGLGPGEVFVHRNVANMVVGTDANLLACLQFAVERLEVEHIIGGRGDHGERSGVEEGA